jgi:hypothetical protein
LKKVIQLLAANVVDDDSTLYVDESLLHQIVIAEGSKAYLTKHISEDNKDRLFKPYKDLCSLISSIILEYNPAYTHPRSLATTIIEMANLQMFFMHHLPLLTDFGQSKDEQLVVEFLEDLVFCSIRK